MNTLSKCLITDQPIENYKEFNGGFEYIVNYNGRQFKLKFAANANWTEVISGYIKLMLQAMLYNNEWPIDPGAIITPQLIRNVNGYENYPREDDFEGKKLKFLEWAYNNGGEKYMPIKFIADDYLIAFAKDKDEFSGIYKALLSNKYIEVSKEENKFELTDLGREEVKKVIAKKQRKIKYNFPQGKAPKLYLSYVEEDKILAEKFANELQEYHMGLMLLGNGIKNDANMAFSNISIARRYIVNGEEEYTADYVIFFQTQNADSNKSFGDILNIAIEEHIRRGGLSELPSFISIVCFDDSQLQARPRYHDYYNNFYDIRLLSGKERCINKISADWIARINQENQNRKITNKIDFLEWLIEEFTRSNINPIFINYSMVNYRIESIELMENLLDQLESYDGAISYDKYPINFAEIKTGYKVTILQRALHLKEEWNQKKLNSKYNFPILKELSSDEKIWLEAIYQKFLNKEEVDVKALRYLLNNKLSNDFKPYDAIDDRLARSATYITLYGIWHIHPESDIFEKTDQVLYTIKELIAEKPGIKGISSDLLLNRLPSLTLSELATIKDLIYGFGGKILSGYGGIPDNPEGINFIVDTDAVYETYRKYTGLYNFICDYYGLNKEANREAATFNINASKEAAFQSKTKPIIRVEKQIEAVLNVKEIAKEIGELINLMSSEKGMMLGVFGRWGRGKTIFLNELWKYLSNIKIDGRSAYIKVEYHAWKYQDTPASWAFLYERLAEEYYHKPKQFSVLDYLDYWGRLFNLNSNRHGIAPVLKFTLSFLFGVLISVGLIQWGSVSALIGIPFISTVWLVFIKYLKKQYSTETTDLIKKYGLRHNYKMTMGLQAEIQRETIELLKTWIPLNEQNKEATNVQHKRIVLFVEDIDRCSEDKIIQSIDALRIMLEDEEVAKRLIVVAAIDKVVLTRAIKAKYLKLLHDGGIREDETQKSKRLLKLTGEYMDKLFISAIKLGSLDALQRDEVFLSMIKEDIESSDILPFERLNNYKEQSKPPVQESTAAPVIENANSYEESAPLPIILGGSTRSDFVASMGEEHEPLKESKTKNSESSSNPPEFEKIKGDELSILRNGIKTWEGATPRRLRIFYYRYLLAKNLLLARYSSMSKPNLWQNSYTHTTFLVLQIIEYTKKYNSVLITKLKREAIKSGKLPSKLKLPNGLDIPVEDYIELMKILEIVIAY